MPKDKSAPKADLDLIDMVQRARMLHDASARPSDYSAVYWIESKRKAGEYPAPTAKTGEWRVHLDIKNVDAVWARVKQATESGRLGYKSKVSTGPAAAQTDPEARLLCVRTYDAGDAGDVARVQRELLALGLSDLEYVGDKSDMSDN